MRHRFARSYCVVALAAGSAALPACGSPEAAGSNDSPALQPQAGGSGNTRMKLTGTVVCSAPGVSATAAVDLPLSIGGHATRVKPDGTFEITGYFTAYPHIVFTYGGDITQGDVSTRLEVVDELLSTRSEARDVVATFVNPGPTTTWSVGTVTLTSLDCELWRIGRKVLDDYHTVVGDSPPAGMLRFKRWSDINLGVPHTFYNHVAIRTDWLADAPEPAERERIAFHEFGHTVRHVADGDQTHWDGDNVSWIYARFHDGTQIANVQYAFNEGWADYWELVRHHGWAAYSTIYDEEDGDFVHWNELLVANRLKELSELPGASHAVMVEVLQDNPGVIHRLYDFEVKLNERLGLPPPDPQPECPPGYFNDGLTCRLGGDIIDQDDYWRPVGALPTACGDGNEYVGGLCYPECIDGYEGFVTMCLEYCAPGFTDTGLYCHKDGSIIDADTSACPWYDICSQFQECSVCPAGYQNDGCTCRIDPIDYPKATYDRGAGWIPTACEGDLQYIAGLCYEPCAEGYTAESLLVCSKPCPEGYHDDGLTCSRPILNIITKY